MYKYTNVPAQNRSN